jgi:hypothetical protein
MTRAASRRTRQRTVFLPTRKSQANQGAVTIWITLSASNAPARV